MNLKVDPTKPGFWPALGSFWLLFLLLAMLFVGSQQAWAADSKFLQPLGYVSDFAGVVDEETSHKLTAICQELDQKTGIQIGLASFKDLGGDEIDGFTSKLFEQWKLGKRGENNGILIVDAIAERKIRLEIGYGLEPIIPDAMAGRIRRDVMTPYLQENKHGEAYLAGVITLAQICAKEKGVTLESLSGVSLPQNEGRRRQKSPFGFLIPLLFMGVIVAISRNRNRGGGFRGGGGMFIGGGGFGGFGGGGGGGFGGFGGGMSGGGGSSGGY